MGHPIRSVIRKLDILLADETTADLLDIEEGAPLFYFHTRGFTDQQVVIEYSISKYRGDTNTFIIEIAEKQMPYSTWHFVHGKNK